MLGPIKLKIVCDFLQPSLLIQQSITGVKYKSYRDLFMHSPTASRHGINVFSAGCTVTWSLFPSE